MPKFIDMTGVTVGRLLVLRRGDNQKDRTTWVCQCECGTVKTIHAGALRSGVQVSCGCYHRERLGNITRTHGMSQTSLYKTYYAMLARCYNPKHPSFPDYGARGIGVCQEWRDDKASFFKWALQNGYDPELSIDREKNDIGYEPSNCRWTTMKVQANNTRGNRPITINGVKKNLTAWSAETGVSLRTFYERLGRGRDEVKAISHPLRAKVIKPAAGSQHTRETSPLSS